MPRSGRRKAGQPSPSHVAEAQRYSWWIFHVQRCSSRETSDWGLERGCQMCQCLFKNCLRKLKGSTKSSFPGEPSINGVIGCGSCSVWLLPSDDWSWPRCTWIPWTKPPWGSALPKNIPAGGSDGCCSFVDAAGVAVVQQAGSWPTCVMGMWGW